MHASTAKPRRARIYTLTSMAFGCALLMLSAFLTISIPPMVPVTLQTFAVFLVTLWLGWKNGFLTVLAYIVCGALGLPVFAGGNGGFGVLVGSTGGYIFGFLLIPLVSGALLHLLPCRMLSKYAALTAGLAACYLFGTIWFTHLYSAANGKIGFLSSLLMCVVPYILPDLAKMTVAILLWQRVAPQVEKLTEKHNQTRRIGQ